MSRQIKTQGIVLARTNFGEADRILTFLTPDHGKAKVIAKAVRKQKSKLAGGIELFSVTDISYVVGRGEISTLTSTRLIKHYGNIVRDMRRTELGYDFIKKLNRATEDHTEPAYFNLLNDAFQALDDDGIGADLTQIWFNAQLLKLAGHTPNLRTDQSGDKLDAKKTYGFNFDSMNFQAGDGFGADQIKFLRLIFSDNRLQSLQKIDQSDKLATEVQGLVTSVTNNFIRQ